jgi:RNA polymerase sigma-70 factor (ECF subfamily)
VSGTWGQTGYLADSSAAGARGALRTWSSRHAGHPASGHAALSVARSQCTGDGISADRPTSCESTQELPVAVTVGIAQAASDFDAFFQRYEQPVYGYLRRMLPSDEIAVEIAQEAFFRAWQHFDDLRRYDRPEAWLYRVATNLAISHLRRKRAFSFSQIFKRAPSESETVEAVGEHELLADPLDVERQTSERDVIVRVLQRLPERQRAALLLRAVYGHSCAEVAQALGISLPNARQTLSRGRERFRRLYEAAQRECEP